MLSATFNNFTVLRPELTRIQLRTVKGLDCAVKKERCRLIRCLGRQGFLFLCDAEYFKKSIASGEWGSRHTGGMGLNTSQD